MKSPLLKIGLLSVSILAIAASAYGLRTRSIAIKAWDEQAKAVKELESREVELVSAREFQRLTVLRDAGLSVSRAVDPHEANEAIRDFVYRSNKVGIGAFGFQRSDQRYAMLGNETGEQLCEGMALAMEWALTQLGVPARTTVLAGKHFLDGKDRFETHAVVEVFLDGKWQISDPTFNVSISCSDGQRNISVPEAAACVRAGGKLIGVPGKSQIVGKGRTIGDYYAPYETFFAAYYRRPSNFPALATLEEYPEPEWIRKSLQLYPETAAVAD